MTDYLGPYWADNIAAALKSGDEQERASVLGVKPRHCFRVSAAKMLESSRRGGQIGGTRRKKSYAKRRGE